MTRRDVRAYLFDIVEACDLVAGFIAGKSFTDYARDPMLRSAVERQAIIIGEALAQISQFWPDQMENFPDRSGIVGFRNHVVHGYFTTNHGKVWDIATVHVPPFRALVVSLLDGLAAEP